MANPSFCSLSAIVIQGTEQISLCSAHITIFPIVPGPTQTLPYNTLDGTYIAFATAGTTPETRRTIFTRDGLNSYPRIQYSFNPNWPGGGGWLISTPTEGLPSTHLYVSYVPLSSAQCPVGLLFNPIVSNINNWAQPDDLYYELPGCYSYGLPQSPITERNSRHNRPPVVDSTGVTVVSGEKGEQRVRRLHGLGLI